MRKRRGSIVHRIFRTAQMFRSDPEILDTVTNSCGWADTSDRMPDADPGLMPEAAWRTLTPG